MRILVPSTPKQISLWRNVCSWGCCTLRFVPLAFWVTVRQQHTCMGTVCTVSSEWAECRKEEKRGAASTPRCLSAVRALAYIFTQGKKKRLEQTVRICESWEQRRKGKGKEWEKQKDHVQEEIYRESEKTEQEEELLWCCEWVHSGAPVAHFLSELQ